MTVAPAPSPTRAPGLAVASALHAIVFTMGALVGPMDLSSWLALSIAPLVLLHASLFVLALVRHAELRARVWLVTSLYSLLWLAALTWVVFSGGLYIAEIYGGMGEAVAAAMVCIWGLMVLFTVPMACWGLAVVRPRWLWRRQAAVVGAVIALVALSSSCALRQRGHLTRVPGVSPERVAAELGSVARTHPGTASGSAPQSILQRDPSECSKPLTRGLTLLVSTLDRRRRALSVCLQTEQVSGLRTDLQTLLSERALPSAPVKLDLVVGSSALARVHPMLDSLAVRPALDGLCAETRCLAPWQLVALDAFTQTRPMSSMRDASFGVALPGLTQALGVPLGAPLVRIETASWVIDGGALHPLVRGRELVTPLDDAQIDHAVEVASAHIIAAERDNGTFRYTLDPFDGRTEERMVSMRRQAGTVFALCELVPPARVAEPATRALGLLASYEKRHGDLVMLGEREDIAEIGPTALPLISFAACRHALGDVNDRLIAGMTRFLLTLQRPDGSFHPELDIQTGKPRGEGESLYAGGQAMLALVLVEQIVRASPDPRWPDATALHDGIERAMGYYGNHYWPRALRSLFYIEENWHCLAARAALGSHRNDDYERFCLDYARFKHRWILGTEASPEHVGAYSMSDIFPPHAAVTAGYGEVLSAALQIQHARGMDVAPDQAKLRTVLGWLIKQQWTPDTCFACGANGEAIGGFSEHTASPKIRIDYVQHAMAALGHGKQALALR